MEDARLNYMMWTITDRPLAAAMKNFQRQYQKLHYMDNYDTMLFDEKDGRPAYQHAMTPERIKKNDELRGAPKAPAKATWGRK